MLVNVNQVSKIYTQADQNIKALTNVSFNVDKGTTLAIVGHSGSGKTTLLSLLAGLEKPSAGSITIDGANITQMSEKQLSAFRAERLGIVFQQFHLMPHLTAFENVSLPLEILGEDNIEERVAAALEQVGLAERHDHLPSQLSGGENQRVAIARAMIHSPSLILADEPSGNLDEETGTKVMDLLFSLVNQNNLSLILVTHDNDLAHRCGQRIHLKGGIQQ